MKWTWVDTVFFIVRGLWFLIWIIIFMNNPLFHSLEIPFSGLLIWLFLAYVVPQCFIWFKVLPEQLYPLFEQLLSGSLYIYLLLYIKSDSSIMLIPAVILGLHYSRYRLWWACVVIMQLIPITGMLFEKGPLVLFLTHLLNNGIALGVGLAFNRMVLLLKQNQEQYKVILEQNNTLEQYARKVESLTLLQERNRMAKELHDTMGHTFTSVIIGMDGVISNLNRSDIEKALKKLRILRKFTKDGLDEIRKNIHQIALSEENEELSKNISKMVTEFSHHTDTIARLNVIGEEYYVNQSTKLTMIRCLQEALTNAKRHGKANNIDITVEFRETDLMVKIKDDGIGASNLNPGFGLTSMLERLQSLQGSLTVHSIAGAGTELTCLIPNGRVENIEVN